jgi:hypothetical protein
MKHIWVLAAWFFLVSPVLAQYYQYADENGTVYFTDNLVEVPVDQRKDLKTYESKNSIADSQTTRKTPPVSPEDLRDPEKEMPEAQVISTMQQLNKEKEILDHMYEQLLTRKQSLQQEKASVSTAAQETALQKKINTLNQDIADFENRRQEFEKKAKIFNTQTVQP